MSDLGPAGGIVVVGYRVRDSCEVAAVMVIDVWGCQGVGFVSGPRQDSWGGITNMVFSNNGLQAAPGFSNSPVDFSIIFLRHENSAIRCFNT